jgi:hypothetical protein
MRVEEHVVLSGAIAALALAATGSPIIAGTTFAAGVIIDGDHAIDFVIYWKSINQRPSTKELLNGSMFQKWGKFGIILHSYELLVLFWTIAFITHSYNLMGWVSISFVAHLFSDQFYYSLYPMFYFFSSASKRALVIKS